MTYVFAVIVLLELYMTLECTGGIYDLQDWTVTNQQFKRDSNSQFVAYDEIKQQIWILGGFYTHYSVYIYDVTEDTLTDVTSTVNPGSKNEYFFNFCTTSTVLINRTMYFSTAYAVISSFNIDNYYFNKTIGFHSEDSMSDAALVTNQQKDKLFIGAPYYGTACYVWDLITETQYKAPSLNVQHRESVSVMIQNMWYVIGGDNMIEYLNVNEMDAWHTADVDLPTDVRAAGLANCQQSVDTANLVYIIGGNIYGSARLQKIFIFDANVTNFQVYVNSKNLPEPTTLCASICVGTRVYLFLSNDYYKSGRFVMYSNLNITSN